MLCNRVEICCKDQLYRQISLFISFAKLTGIQSNIHIYYVLKLGISQLLFGQTKKRKRVETLPVFACQLSPSAGRDEAAKATRAKLPNCTKLFHAAGNKISLPAATCLVCPMLQLQPPLLPRLTSGAALLSANWAGRERECKVFLILMAIQKVASKWPTI